jgi:4a-hydroxytetrahydrobiopterin dehydratase
LWVVHDRRTVCLTRSPGTTVSQTLLDNQRRSCHGVLMSRLLTDEEIERQLGELPGWRRDADSIVASYVAPDFPTAVQLIVGVGEQAEQMNHHPDVDLRWKVTRWRLSTHSAGGLTQLDVELAHRISQIAAQLNASAEATP